MACFLASRGRGSLHFPVPRPPRARVGQGAKPHVRPGRRHDSGASPSLSHFPFFDLQPFSTVPERLESKRARTCFSFFPFPIWSDMFYAAMYALKGREDRRAASALQQMTGVDLGGQPGTPECWAARAALRAAPLPSSCPLAASLLRAAAGEAMRVLPAGRVGALAHQRVPRLQGSACPPA